MRLRDRPGHPAHGDVDERGRNGSCDRRCTGEDPALTPCVDDAAVATGDTRADNSLLEIVWSDKCQAGWGRITRYDGLGNGNTVSIAIYPQTSPDGPDRQEATEHDVQGAYTTLVVRPTPDTLLSQPTGVTQTKHWKRSQKHGVPRLAVHLPQL